MNGIKAPKNGYVYAYISNQSDGDVYFDNFALTLSQGNIVEENHYYSFGLRIATLSSKKYSDGFDGEVDNKYGMQGAYSEMDDDIGWNDFALRNYDAQIGRFVQQDPYGQFYSPYTGMGNDPVNLIDPSGGIGIPCPGTSSLSIFLEGAFYAAGHALEGLSKVGTIISIASFTTQTGIVASNMIGASEVVNGQLPTNGVGSGELGIKLSQDQDHTSQIIPFWIFEDRWPDVYRTHLMGKQKNPNLVQADGSILLTYDPTKSNQRRRRKQAQVANGLFPNPNPAQFDVDEFPYASTLEGGSNAAAQLVDITQNRTHGGYVGATVRFWDMKAGDKFKIILVPKTKKRVPEPKTVPTPVPYIPPIALPIPNKNLRPVPAPIRGPSLFIFWGPLFEIIFDTGPKEELKG